jgi:regulator of sigma E protease
VSLGGERPGEDQPEGFQPRHSFTGRPAWQRMIIIAAGPLANFVLAVAIIYALILAQGVPTPVPLVAEVVSGSPAEAAGLKAGDRIVVLAGHEVKTTAWDFVLEAIRRARQRVPHELTILRGGESINACPITPRITTAEVHLRRGGPGTAHTASGPRWSPWPWMLPSAFPRRSSRPTT